MERCKMALPLLNFGLLSIPGTSASSTVPVLKQKV
jgi:hypothetical protein